MAAASERHSGPWDVQPGRRRTQSHLRHGESRPLKCLRHRQSVGMSGQYKGVALFGELISERFAGWDTHCSLKGNAILWAHTPEILRTLRLTPSRSPPYPDCT